jgi:membrane associated rhomboid family serine protease
VIPLRDSEPSGITPYVTIGIIVLNVVVTLWQLGPGKETSFDHGLRPAYLCAYIEGQESLVVKISPVRHAQVEITFATAVLPLLLSMFLHAGIWHLLGNMWFLWIFGDNVEGRLGHVRFLIFYLICGIGAGLAHTALTPASVIPTVGASGAVAGALGAYWLCFPHSRVLVLLWLLFFIRTFEMRASWFLGIWIGIDVFRGLTDSGGMVAVWAHVGGFVAGMGLVILMTPADSRGKPTRFRIVH